MLSLLEFLAYIWAFVVGAGQMIFGTPARIKRSLTLYNTLSGKKERFESLRPEVVKMYNCGPTVYGVQHIGNLSMYVFTDILRRALEANGYDVMQVINITDVGHLVSDGDDGEDKMTKGLKSEGKELTLENMRELAEKYTKLWLQDLKTLNITIADTQFPRASDHIPAQIAMVRALEKNGFAYKGEGGVYFDTAKFPSYGKLGNINLEGLREGARIAAVSDKRNSTDFLLWKFDPKLGWESPWGVGFPGWHIECSAMIREILGDEIDIHTGGIEHIPVHHNNEIAQSEASTGKKPFSRFWLHRAHLQIESAKIAKSVGNTVYLSRILERGFHPLSFRYLLLGAHYRQPSNFTWDALEASQKAYLKLVKIAHEISGTGSLPQPYIRRFVERINDDLDTPGALAIMWEMVNDTHIAPENLKTGLEFFDTILGLKLTNPDEQALEMYRKEFGAEVSAAEIPERVKSLLAAREEARMDKKWDVADKVRKEIEDEGYVIEDTADGPRVIAKY
ncbi:MAG: cysteine--tRNA ligase [Minisyncoccia bacterium]